MRSSVHPSPEALNAYFDQELPSADRAPIDQHLVECPGCRDSLKAFGALTAVAPELDPALPGEAYWADLPDRILARIVAGPVPAPAARPWSRWLSPRWGWRYAAGVMASVALASGAWWTFHQEPNPARPGDPLDPVATGIPDEIPEGSMSPLQAEHIPAVSPESYNERVLHSLGTASNPGVPLDIYPGQTNESFASRGGIGVPVTEQLPPLGAEAVKQAEPFVSYGCGDNSVESAYLNALRAEEEGDTYLAAVGYNTVRSALAPGSPLYLEADFRLNRLAWRDRVHRTYAAERGQVLAELRDRMQHAFNTWKQTGLDRDCEKAQCYIRVFMDLSPEVSSPNQVQVTQVRMEELRNCSN